MQVKKKKRRKLLVICKTERSLRKTQAYVIKKQANYIKRQITKRKQNGQGTCEALLEIKETQTNMRD